MLFDERSTIHCKWDSASTELAADPESLVADVSSNNDFNQCIDPENST